MTTRVGQVLATVGLCFVPITALQACGDEDSQSAASTVGEQGPTTSIITLQGQRMKIYESLEELTDEASLVVLATATDEVQYERRERQVPWTLTRMTTDRVVDGSDAPSTFNLRQVGDADTRALDMVATVEPGSQYLLWLTPTGLARDSGDAYFVTGAAGAYQIEKQTAVRLDPLSIALPKQPDKSTLVRAIARNSK